MNNELEIKQLIVEIGKRIFGNTNRLGCQTIIFRR